MLLLLNSFRTLLSILEYGTDFGKIFLSYNLKSKIFWKGIFISYIAVDCEDYLSHLWDRVKLTRAKVMVKIPFCSWNRITFKTSFIWHIFAKTSCQRHHTHFLDVSFYQLKLGLLIFPNKNFQIKHFLKLPREHTVGYITKLIKLNSDDRALAI